MGINFPKQDRPTTTNPNEMFQSIDGIIDSILLASLIYVFSLNDCVCQETIIFCMNRDGLMLSASKTQQPATISLLI